MTQDDFVPVEEGHRALQMLREAFDAVSANGEMLECVEGSWYRIVETSKNACKARRERPVR